MHTQNINTLFSTAPTVTWTRLIVKLHAHCLSCFLYECSWYWPADGKHSLRRPGGILVFTAQTSSNKSWRALPFVWAESRRRTSPLGWMKGQRSNDQTVCLALCSENRLVAVMLHSHYTTSVNARKNFPHRTISFLLFHAEERHNCRHNKYEWLTGITDVNSALPRSGSDTDYIQMCNMATKCQNTEILVWPAK